MAEVDNPNSVPSGPVGSTMSRPVTGPGSKERPGTGKIWTVEGDEKLADLEEGEGDMGDLNSLSSSSVTSDLLSEEDQKILMEKEFDDYYEDRVHKSAGPIVFLSKCMAMLPVIWTDDDAESECKTYFNLYTFIMFLAWFGLAVIAALRVDKMDREIKWPAEVAGMNSSSEARFLTRMTVDAYVGCLFSNCLTAILFGIFKCTSFAEVLYTTSAVDSQLELKEKHYDKIKRKTLYWVLLEVLFIIGHCVGIVFMMEDMQRDIILLLCILAANLVVGVLDLQYIHLCMVLCKRYRMLNKIMAHITKPFRTFRSEEPSHEMLQKILSYRWETVKKEEVSKTFDHIWEPSEKDAVSLPDATIVNPEPVKVDMSKMEVPPAIWMKSNDKEITREEETTVMLQLDILRSIHSDLHHVGQEINMLLGFQLLVHIVTSVAIIVIFGFFTTVTALDGMLYWPFLAIVITPVLRVLLIGHWAQVAKDTSMKPFWTMSGMSTLDGSPKLERQVQKLGLQAAQKTARISAAGYFYITRNTITRVFGMSLLFIFLLVKFDRLERSGSASAMDMMTSMTSMTAASAAATDAAAAAAAAATGTVSTS